MSFNVIGLLALASLTCVNAQLTLTNAWGDVTHGERYSLQEGVTVTISIDKEFTDADFVPPAAFDAFHTSVGGAVTPECLAVANRYNIDNQYGWVAAGLTGCAFEENATAYLAMSSFNLSSSAPLANTYLKSLNAMRLSAGRIVGKVTCVGTEPYSVSVTVRMMVTVVGGVGLNASRAIFVNPESLTCVQDDGSFDGVKTTARDGSMKWVE